MKPPPHTAIIMLTGFLQGQHRNNGFDDGHHNFIRQFASPSVTVYHPRSWKTNVKNLLDQLHLRKIHRVVILAYSHGTSAAIQFCRLAPSYGITEIILGVCDGVWRPQFAPRRTMFQAFAAPLLWKTPKVKVPRSVQRVFGVYQDITWPRGCPFVAADPRKTIIEPFQKLPISHKLIPHHQAWWDKATSEIDGFINPPRAIIADETRRSLI